MVASTGSECYHLFCFFCASNHREWDASHLDMTQLQNSFIHPLIHSFTRLRGLVSRLGRAHQLYGYHEDGLEGEGAVAEVKQVL